MSNTIKIKKSNSAGATPNTLEHGELAINYVDGKLYYKDSSNNIKNLVETRATVSDSRPSNPITGSIWYESDTGKTFVYYDNFWVEIGGEGGPASIVVSDTAPTSFTALWADTSTSGTMTIPSGGSAGQFLYKNSNTAYDTSWNWVGDEANVVLGARIFR